jgi:hypothetical protein
MDRNSLKLPPLMQRTLRDDFKWAFAVLLGGVIGVLIFGAGDGAWSLLLGLAIGCAVVLVVLSVVRLVAGRRRT